MNRRHLLAVAVIAAVVLSGCTSQPGTPETVADDLTIVQTTADDGTVCYVAFNVDEQDGRDDPVEVNADDIVGISCVPPDSDVGPQF